MPSFLLLIAWQAKHKACLLSHDHTSPPSLMGMIWSDTTASMASPSRKQVAQSGFSCLCALLSFLHCGLLYSLLSSLNLERWKALATIDQGCFFCFLLTVGIRMVRLLMGLFRALAFALPLLSYQFLHCFCDPLFFLGNAFLCLAVLM